MPENCHKGPFLMGTVTYSIIFEKRICLHQKEIPSLDKTPVRVTDHTHFPDSPPRPSPNVNPFTIYLPLPMSIRSLSTFHPQCQSLHYLSSTPNVNPFTVYLPPTMSIPSLSTFHPQCQYCTFTVYLPPPCQYLHCLPSIPNVNTVPSLSTFHPQC